MSQYKLDVKKPNTFTLLLIYSFPACIAVSLSPALTSIAHSYGLSSNAVKDVMTLSMLGYAIGPLLSAPVTTFLGRKVTVIIGSVVAVAGLILSVMAFYSSNYALFLVGRFVATFGGGIAFCLSYAIISDFYKASEARNVLAVIAAAFCLIPGIVMAISGQLTHFLGWQYTLFFMLAYAVATIVLTLNLPETGSPIPFNKKDIQELDHDYLVVLKNKSFLYSCIIIGLAISLLYVYATDASLIASEKMKMGPSLFGYLSVIPYIGAIVSLTAVRIFSRKLTYLRTTLMSFILMLIGAGAALAAFMGGTINMFTLFGFTFILIAGSIPINVSYATIAENISPYRGIEASLISSLFMFISIFAVKVSSFLHPYLGWLEYPITALIMIALMALFCLLLYRHDPKVFTPDSEEAAQSDLKTARHL